MMKNNPFLRPAVIGLVTLLHAGVIALSWNGFKPTEPAQADAMAFVDLGSVEGDDKPLGDGAPAPMEQPEPPKSQPPVEQPKPRPKVEPKPVPKPEPKPKVVEHPKVAAVVRNDKPADFRQPEKVVEPPKREIKPEPIKIKQPETPKPQPQPQPEKTEQAKPAATPSANSSSNNVAVNKDAANRAPDGIGGGGSNPNSKVPQNGAGDKNSDGHGKKGDAPKPSNNAGNGGVADGGYISLPNPPYPRAAQENGDSGVVKLSVLVSAAGKVMEVKVTKSSGSAALDNAGKRAAQSASYRPKKVDGEFVATRFSTQFTFELSE